MNSDSMHATIKQSLLLLGASSLLFIGLASAQVPVDTNGDPISSIEPVDNDFSTIDPEVVFLSAAELETLVGPVALYPDDLLAIVLPASTYPLEIVQAARFLERLNDDPTLKPDDAWDDSIIALLNYPEVVNLMNDDLDWTWKLGEAVIAQQNDLVASIETFRDRAYAAGNLATDEYQTVSNNDGIIEIEPVSDDVIYVPYYEPERVVVYQTQPVYSYYPQPYPVYNYPYAAGHSFGSGFFWGVTTAYTIGWANDYLNVYHPSYFGHPYYGRTYYGNYYWRRPSLSHYNNDYVNNRYRRSNDHYRNGDYWRPRPHGGARPGHQVARNSYYGGRQHSNSSNYQYRDGRTNGLSYNGKFRSSRSTTSGSGRHVPGSRNVRASASTTRPTVEFRQRRAGTVVGSSASRVARGSGSTSTQITRRSTTAHRTANSRDGNNAVRFRSRTPTASRAPTRATSVRQARRQTEVAAAGSAQIRRTSSTTDRIPRSNRNPVRSPTTASTTRGRQAAPSRVSSPTRRVTSQHQSRPAGRPATSQRQSRPATRPVTKQRQSRPSASRAASAPRQARQSSNSNSRPSSRKESPRRNKTAAGSKRNSGGQRSSNRRTH